MRRIQTERAARAATPFESFGILLSKHRAITRVLLAALSFSVLASISQQPPAQAGPEAAPVIPESLLPLNVGIAVDTGAEITIPFDVPMDGASVESTLQVLPTQQVEMAWNDDRTALTIRPERLWRADERYLLVVSAESESAEGSTLRGARRYSFTTATAPAVIDFQVHLAATDLPAGAATVADATLSSRTAVLDGGLSATGNDENPQPIGSGAVTRPPTNTAKAVSASTSIAIDFSAEMDTADVEQHFTISPQIAGALTWVGDDLVFSPSERLQPGTRYTISVIGSHDLQGNPLGGKTNFSFIVQAGAQLTRTDPDASAQDVTPTSIEMWFSQPMDTTATARALRVTETTADTRVKGKVTWNEAATQLTFTPNSPLAGGKAFRVAFTKDAVDADGNQVVVKWWFRTEAPPPPPVAAPAPAPVRATVTTHSTPSIPPPAPATSLAGYALNQVNAARAAYGFAPIVLDASISAVASAHAWDQANNGYFSHFGLDGSSRQTRLARGGVGFGWSGENQCYHYGMSQEATLNWCHSAFMAEPYPGQWNHIANILNPNARRMGVGIATVGSKTVITWNFTD